MNATTTFLRGLCVATFLLALTPGAQAQEPEYEVSVNAVGGTAELSYSSVITGTGGMAPSGVNVQFIDAWGKVVLSVDSGVINPTITPLPGGGFSAFTGNQSANPGSGTFRVKAIWEFYTGQSFETEFGVSEPVTVLPPS